MRKLMKYKILALLLLVVGLPAMGQEQFERKLEQVSFVPKGAWISGVSVGYSQTDQDNYQFLFLEKLTGDSYSFKLSPTVMFCFKDNLTAGGRFSYNRQRMRLNSADIVVDSDLETRLGDIYSVSHDYLGMGLFRVYTSLGRSTRFGLFNEIQLQMGGGQGKVYSGVGKEISGTYSTNFQMGIGLAPGMSMFLNNYCAIECNVGVLGFKYVYSRDVTDQIYEASLKRKSAIFNVDLFSITFGVMFYI